MGCWGLLGVAGMVLTVMKWIIPENSLLSTSKTKTMKINISTSEGESGESGESWSRNQNQTKNDEHLCQDEVGVSLHFTVA